MDKARNILVIIILNLMLFSLNAFAHNHRAKNAYDFSLVDAKTNKLVNLSEYEGKLILLVQHADLCGFTRNIFELDNLKARYQDRGFEVILLAENQDIKMCGERLEWINFPVLIKDNQEFIEWISYNTQAMYVNNILISPFGEIVSTYDGNDAVNIDNISQYIEYNLPDMNYDAPMD